MLGFLFCLSQVFSDCLVSHTNPFQVSSQQTLELIYLPRKDGKQSYFRRRKKVTQRLKYRQSQDRTGDFVVERQRSYQLRQPCRPDTPKSEPRNLRKDKHINKKSGFQNAKSSKTTTGLVQTEQKCFVQKNYVSLD